jgi:hypothetical protein
MVVAVAVVVHPLHLRLFVRCAAREVVVVVGVVQ